MINLRFILLKGILAMLFVATAISCEKDQRVETKENIALTSEVVRPKNLWRPVSPMAQFKVGRRRPIVDKNKGKMGER